ncbi:hypothetical protein OVY48_10025 [Sphingobium sp. SA2]|uniref:hypothetical protein n=1 Tax=Sphingobium sp. SA2 TaxID=1524832 RepID=UPI0028C0DCB7|nr:hypothetical protein [Sphingobium sp. SA2]MDT7533761.1 hypothetical protein [Sphingobium sp. SA2]
MITNLKTLTIEIEPSHAAAMIEWLNRNHPDARSETMTKDDVQSLVRGDRLIMHEATMGVGNDGVEHIYAPGTPAIFWMLERLGSATGLAATLVIGPADDDEAITNFFYERDPAGFPFRRADER